MAATMDKHSPIGAEFSRLVPVDRLEQGEVIEEISAREGERRALAARFDLVALDGLRAEVSLRRIESGPIVRLEGRLSAEVVQTCVVSLEPVANRVEEAFSLLYAPEGRIRPQRRGGEVGGEERSEWPEPIEQGAIDIGEAVAQQLALALDPYPRKPGIRLEDVIGKPGWQKPGEPAANPFAVLARLSKRGS
jgi:uncharacterized metal-binding protein YceD (DUF177 family)